MSAVAAEPVEAVLFDYGMVLSGPPDAAVWARMCEIAGLEDARLHAAYWAPRHDYDRGALNGASYWAAVATRAGVDFDPGQVARLKVEDIALWTQLNGPMVAWAARLQHAGIKTGILSNLGDAMTEGVLEKLAWLADFDHCTWSHTLKMAKPEAAIYAESAKALGVAPKDVLFIDDRADNVAGAEAAGMQAIRYTGHPEFEDEMRQRGFGDLLQAGIAAT